MKLVMRLSLILLTAAGCTFHGAQAVPDDAPGTPDDASIPIDTSVVMPDASALVVPCATASPAGLIACFEFEDGVSDGVLADSSPKHHDASTSGLVPTTRTTSHAAEIGASSMTYAAQSTDFDRANGYTMSLWVNPSALPGEGEVQGILDHELQYAMALVTTAGITDNRCIHTGGTLYELTSNLPTNQWSFLACTWDGSTLCAIRWTSPTDHERNCTMLGTPPAASGAHGLAIGHLSTAGSPHDHFQGAIDSVHVFDHRLASDQLCTDVGQGSGCLPCDQCD